MQVFCINLLVLDQIFGAKKVYTADFEKKFSAVAFEISKRNFINIFSRILYVQYIIIATICCRP